MEFGIMGFQAELEQGIVGTEKPAGGWQRKQKVLLMNGTFIAEDSVPKVYLSIKIVIVLIYLSRDWKEWSWKNTLIYFSPFS